MALVYGLDSSPDDLRYVSPFEDCQGHERRKEGGKGLRMREEKSQQVLHAFRPGGHELIHAQKRHYLDAYKEVEDEDEHERRKVADQTHVSAADKPP